MKVKLVFPLMSHALRYGRPCDSSLGEIQRQLGMCQQASLRIDVHLDTV